MGIKLSLEAWADLVSGNVDLFKLVEKDLIKINGEFEQIKAFFSLFENSYVR